VKWRRKVKVAAVRSFIAPQRRGTYRIQRSRCARSRRDVASLHPNVVLLDLSMPGMDGYELARRIRAESWGKEALLVALTGWGQDQHRRRSHEAGFDRHIIKPADAEALRAVLDSC